MRAGSPNRRHATTQPGPATVASVLCLGIAFSLVILIGGRSLSAAAPQDEVIANLSAGRVLIYVAKEGIAIGVTETRVEVDTRPPIVVPLSGKRAGILLGATEWAQPASGRKPVRLEQALTDVVQQLGGGAPRLEQEAASDIEQIGLNLLGPLRNAVGQLHARLELKPEEYVVELILAGYTEGYGAEVWSLRYRAVQEPLRGEYWRTRILRPSYTQLWPPEKDRPRTLLEVRYPPELPGAALLDLLRENDPRLAPLRSADQRMARAIANLEKGECQKTPLAEAAQFLRAALNIVGRPEERQAVAIIQEQRGFQWVLAPAEPVGKAEDQKPREPGAPTLRKPP